VLTVHLPKSATAQVALSCYLNPADLSVMGVWGWMRELFEAAQLAAAQNPVAATEVNVVSDLAALVTRLVLEGGHEMITPARTLTLVHAVQQPLCRPIFVQLPAIHRPSQPYLASALRNLFTPVTAWRSYGSHDAVLLGGLEVHGQSSAQIDLQARWLEETDDPTQPAPTKSWASDHVVTISLSNLAGGPIFADATQNRMVAVYIPQTNTLWFSAPFDELAGVTTPSAVAAPLHRFADTKHRWVYYQAVATSRFREYFPQAGTVFTRSSDPLLVDIPSSARPVAPDVAYVVPTFGWEEQETTNVKTSVRFGNSLRVYLHRPWLSSGANELLGLVLWPLGNPAPDYRTREQYKPFLTQWGNDPIWQSGTLEPIPSWADFPGAAQIGKGLMLEETAQPFDVAGHKVAFDKQRGLWYCDITFGNLPAYAAFVRMALARYQPHSIQGVELSRVVLADFAQLAPNRSAFLSIDPADPRRARLVIGGLAPEGPTQSQITVTVEARNPHIASDLGWEKAPAGAVQVIEDAPAPAEPGAALWSGTIVFARRPLAGEFRIVVREYEVIPGDPPANSAVTTISVQRLVYATIMAYDFPATKPN
jgi:hypothetical protein